jgi:hypothetical protein
MNANDHGEMTPPPVPEGLETVTPKTPEQMADEMAEQDLMKEGETMRELMEKSFEDRGAEMLKDLKDSAVNAAQGVFARMRSGAKSVFSGAGRLMAKAVGAAGFGIKVGGEIGRALAENAAEGAKDIAGSLAWGVGAEGRAAVADYAKQVPGAVVESVKALGGVPRGIVEKIKGDKALDAIAKELEASTASAEEMMTDYSPEAIRRREEAESQAAFEALFEEVPMTEQMTDFLKKLTNGGVEVISYAPRGAWEMAKFVNNDLFIPTVKGNAEALKYLMNSLSNSAGELYRGGKESAGKRMEQAADLVKSASGWVENAVKYMKENKIQLNKETTRANDKYQNRLAELRIANAKNVLSEPELTSRRIEQLTQQGVKEGLTPEAAAARANKDAASMLEQAGLSAERIQQTFEAVKALEALESQVPDVTEFMEEDEEMAA